MKQATLSKAIEVGKKDIIDYLINSKYDIGQKNFCQTSRMQNAISLCCSRGDLETLQLAIKLCSKYRIPTELFLRESFHSAVIGNNEAIFPTLLRAGADVDDVSAGVSALEAAIGCQNSNMVSWLIDSGAKPNIETNSYPDSDYDVDRRDDCKVRHAICGNPLVMAIFRADIDVVERLLNAGASLNALGVRELHQFQLKCHCILPITAALQSKNYVLLHRLIALGGAINNPPGSSAPLVTPLVVALESHNIGLISFLLEIGANPYDCVAIIYARYDVNVSHVLLGAMRRWSTTLSSK
jgi:ankyrin repeat protein